MKKRLLSEKTHHKDGKPLFQDNYLYLTFSSESGCSVAVKFYQTESRANKMKQALYEYKSKIEEITRQKLYEFDGNQDPYQQELLETYRREEESRNQYDQKAQNDPEKYILGY